MLVIASALSVPDPRDRPLAKQQAADQAHLLFRDERSDFLSLLALVAISSTRSSARSLRTAGSSTRAVRISSRTFGCANGATCTRSSRARSPSRAWQWTPELPATVDVREVPVDSSRRCSPGLHRQHRHAGRRERRLRRRARHPLLPASGLGSREEAAEVGAGRRSSSKRRGSSRAARRRSSPNGSEAVAGDRVTRDYFEPQLGRGARRSGRERARAALRTDARRAAARVVRQHRSRRPRARCSFARRSSPARSRRSGDVPRAQPEARGRGGGARAQGAAAGRAGRRRRRSRAFYAERVARRRPLARESSSSGARRSSATIRRCCS